MNSCPLCGITSAGICADCGPKLSALVAEPEKVFQAKAVAGAIATAHEAARRAVTIALEHGPLGLSALCQAAADSLADAKCLASCEVRYWETLK